MKYRQEIDGLRALAVVPVILFHAGFTSFSGGYVGVDVFFVISGYLITSLVLERVERGDFSVAEFYERRARRILPALFLMVFTCAPIAWLLLLPTEMKDFSESVFSTAIFASNFLFWRESGYFDFENTLKPLSHTWSLAVEEQWYVIFPLLFPILWRYSKRVTIVLMACAFVGSLSLAQFFVKVNPAASFYLLPTRIWELLLGALVAFYLFRHQSRGLNRYRDEILGILGMSLIIGSAILFDERTPNPSLVTLIPTLGTAMTIVFGTNQTIVGKICANRFFVFIGLLSYSAYLWHQPIFAFARTTSRSEPSHLVFVMLILLVFLIAFLSWHFVEKPFRRSDTLTRPKIIALVVVCTLVMSIIGGVGHISHGFKERLPPNITWESLGRKLAATGKACEPQEARNFPGIETCTFGSTKSTKSILLLGDSHADSIERYLGNQFEKRNIRGIRARIANCGVIPNLADWKEDLNGKKDCEDKFQSLISFVRVQKATVIVVSRWSFSLYPVVGQIDDMPYKNSEGGVEREKYREYGILIDDQLDFSGQAKRRALEGLVEGLLDSGQTIVLLYPIPEIGWDIARENWSHYRQYNELLDGISIPTRDYLERNKFVVSVFDAINNQTRLIRVKPFDVFCNTFVKDRCVAQIESIPLYYDDDHLSYMGSKYLVDSFIGDL